MGFGDSGRKRCFQVPSQRRADFTRRKHPGTGGPPRKEGIYTEIIADVFGDMQAKRLQSKNKTKHGEYLMQTVTELTTGEVERQSWQQVF